MAASPISSAHKTKGKVTEEGGTKGRQLYVLRCQLLECLQDTRARVTFISESSSKEHRIYTSDRSEVCSALPLGTYVNHVQIV